jgi:hypothetical protein
MPKFEKGSQEAKDHMAKLRAARKPKEGGKIGDSIKKTFKKASKAVADVATDAYHMSPADAVAGIKSTGSKAVSAMGGAIPEPPSRLPSSMFNVVGSGMGSDDEEALHDCPMCVGMGIVKKKKIY